MVMGNVIVVKIMLLHDDCLQGCVTVNIFQLNQKHKFKLS